MRPAIIAHRGRHDQAPENSTDAMLAALEAGADAVETDVHATVDGVVVLHHDPYLSRQTGRRNSRGPRIADLLYSQLVGSRLADGSEIPRLEDVLQLAAGRAHVHVEIKARGIERHVTECITRASQDASVHSFDHRIIRNCAGLAPAIPRGILLESQLVDLLRVMRDAHARDVWQQYSLIDGDLVNMVHSEGGRVVAWTVNDAGVATELALLGVDAICTDDIEGVRQALAAT
jgi:glycerophosphoryl diester phosphodiesterase